MIILRVKWDHNYHWRPNSTRREDPKWQALREELFRDTTLASLQRQTNTDWRCWLWCDVLLAPLTQGLAQKLGDARLEVTYSIGESCRLQATYAPVEEPVIFGRIDSDDILHPEALARWAQETEPGLVQFGWGYALERVEGAPARLFEWNHPSSPFIAQIDARDIMRYQTPELGGNHGQVYKIARRIEDQRFYMVTIHGDNVCNHLAMPWCGPEIVGRERTKILDEFHVGAIASTA